MSNPLSNNKSPAISITLMLALVILFSAIGSARAEENPVAASQYAPATSLQQGPSDTAELEAFLDGLLAKQLTDYQIAGAAVSVVKDGKLFFAKGYGYADLANKIPVDPERTIFSLGSIGKTFTWTAVMQLAEQGKLDLDADINTYLDFRIPDTYPQPITLRNLMTHTSGFEDRLFGSLATDPKDLLPAREWLIRHMSARVRPPGDCVAYANYNAMLAGYIVARVSGQPYETYIEENILKPLGMLHSSAQSVLPPDLRGDQSVGYTYADGAFKAFPGYYLQEAVLPSGAMRASATDVARFMIANLQNGRYSDAQLPDVRIFNVATAQQMHSTQYTPDPRLLGITYGFFDFSDNGQRTLGNIGYLPPMHSLLLILPDQDLGVFVAYNSDGGGDLTNQHIGFQRAFFDHYYPAPAVEPIQAPAGFAKQAGRFEGTYRMTQGSRDTLEKVGGLFGAVEVRAADDGTLRFIAPFGEWRFVQVDGLYFRQVDGPFGLMFREDAAGRITQVATDLTPQFAFNRLKWYETPGFSTDLALGCLLIFRSMLPVGVIRWIRNRRPAKDKKVAPRGAGAAQWLLEAISILNVVFVVGVMQWGQPISVLHPITMTAKIVLGLGVLSAALTAGAILYAFLAWKNRYWGLGARVYYTLVTLAAVAFVWFTNYWNLLGWRF